MFRMLTGVNPYWDIAQQTQLLQTIATDQVSVLDYLRAHNPAKYQSLESQNCSDLLNLIEQCTQANPEIRFSIDEVLAQLEQLSLADSSPALRLQ